MALFQFLFCFVARKLGIFVVFIFLFAGNRDFFFFSQAVALFDFFFVFCFLFCFVGGKLGIFFLSVCWREIGDFCFFSFSFFLALNWGFFSLFLLAGNWGIRFKNFGWMLQKNNGSWLGILVGCFFREMFVFIF